MKSRERVAKTLQHEEPDRVPIDIGGMRSTGIHSLAYKNLREHLGMEADSIKIFDIWQQLGLIDRDVLEYFEGDTLPLIRLKPAFGIRIDEWKEGSLVDGSPALVPKDYDPVREDGWLKIEDDKGHTLLKKSKDAYYFDQAGAYNPLAKADSIEDLKEMEDLVRDWTNPVGDDERQYLEEKVDSLYQETDYAILPEFGGSIFEQGQILRGYKQWYLDLAGKKDFVKYLVDMLVENYLRNIRTFVDILGDKVDLVLFVGDDMGNQGAPQLSPDTYREIFKPRHKKMWDFVHENTNWKVFLHSCGSIMELMPDLIDAGVDIINPVQTTAENMSAETLKSEFGQDVVFWGGGCDTQKTLPKGTPEEVRDEVRRNIEIFAPGGGFVFTPIHNIQPDVPPENIVAMYEAAAEYGWY